MTLLHRVPRLKIIRFGSTVSEAYHWARALELFNHAILGGDSDSTNLVACTVAFQALQLAGPSWTRGAKRLSNHMGARHDVVSSSDSHPASIHA